MRRLFYLLFALTACGAQAPSAATVAVPTPQQKPSTAKPSAPTTSATPKLTITLHPADDASSLDVTVVAEGPADSLRTFSVEDPRLFDLNRTTVHDAKGAIPFASMKPGTLTLNREPEGAVTVVAQIPARAAAPPAPAWVHVDPDRFEVRGEAVLPLPIAFEDANVDVVLTLDAGKLGTGQSGVASSFGLGKTKQVVAKGKDLRKATFVAGPLGTAVFDAAEGHDEAAWVGYTAFDPRPVCADIASFRTALGQVMGSPSRSPSTLLIVTDTRQVGQFDVTRRSGGVLLHVAPGEPWSAPVRIAVATALVQRFVGGELWIGPEGERGGEALWFTGGLARFFARDLLFRYGLLAPDEVASEAESLSAKAVTSKLAKESNQNLASTLEAPGVVPLLLARGALYANGVDARLREKSKGKEGLSQVLVELLTEARQKNSALGNDAWLTALSKRLGAEEASLFEKAIQNGQVLPLPKTALGPCFRGETKRYQGIELGFDEAKTDENEGHVVQGLDPKGPAAKAGLQQGDIVVHVDHGAGRADSQVELTVERDDQRKTVKYEPRGASASGQGWKRVEGVPSEACVP